MQEFSKTTEPWLEEGGMQGALEGWGMDVGYGGVAGESARDQILKDSGGQAHQFGQIKNLRLRKAIYWTH